MDKNKLITIIQGAKVSDELKKELLALVEQAESFGPETVREVQAKLDREAQAEIDRIMDLKIQNAVDELNQEMDDLEKDVNEFQGELNQKADEIDKKTVREELSQ